MPFSVLETFLIFLLNFFLLYELKPLCLILAFSLFGLFLYNLVPQYLLALTYFLFFAEGYGRSVEGRMYAYNLQPFREIKRFWVHREMLGTFAVFCNLAGNVIGFIPFGMILPVIWPKTRKMPRKSSVSSPKVLTPPPRKARYTPPLSSRYVPN